MDTDSSSEICRLRCYRRDDVDAIPAQANDLDVARYMSRNFPHPYTRSDAEAWLDIVLGQHVPINFAIEVDGAVAGGIGFFLFNDERFGTADVGYWLGRAFWGRGIATYALKTIVRYGFLDLELRRIQSRVMAANVASARVLEHAGFTLEGTQRAYCVDREGTEQDALLYGLLSASSRSQPQSG